MAYSLPAEIQRFDCQGKRVLINPLVPSWIVTDRLGELIIDLFNGNNELSDVVSIAVDGLGIQYKEKIIKFCESVVLSRLFEIPFSTDDKQPYPLSIVHLSLSENCNLHCKYCYASERKEKSSKSLSIDEYKSIIDQVVAINANCSFTLTGGEPLLNPLWKDISCYIKEKEAQCCLLSNGTLITKNNINNIKRIFDTVILSIDGSTEEKHARTRGNNLDKVENAIKLLEQNDVNYTLSMTVCRSNMDDVEAMAKKYGPRLKFAPLFPVHEYAKNELSITGKEYYNVLKQAAGVRPLSYCKENLSYSQIRRNHKCAIGDGEISISPTGDVYPCQLLHVPDFYAGNIREQSIKIIYTNSSNLIFCQQLDVDRIEGCKDCAFRYICGGACRARSYYECKDIMKNGDFCLYEKQAYLDGIVELYQYNCLI